MWYRVRNVAICAIFTLFGPVYLFGEPNFILRMYGHIEHQIFESHHSLDFLQKDDVTNSCS